MSTNCQSWANSQKSQVGQFLRIKNVIDIILSYIFIKNNFFSIHQQNQDRYDLNFMKIIR